MSTHELPVDPAAAVEQLVAEHGGRLFGAGMALLGYCPGTGLAALGDGSRHAWAGVAGMLAGAAVYAEAYPWVKANLLGVGSYGKITLPAATGVTPWIYFAVLLAAAVLGFRALRSFEQRRRRRASTD